MWPWEHLAIGYVAYSLWVRSRGESRPGSAAVIALAIGTQFPDLIDKPLGWGTTILPSGTSLAHSLLFAVPVSVLAIAVAGRRGSRELGVAFAIGYLLHLPGDLAYYVLLGSDPPLEFLLWPLIPAPSSAPGSIVGRTAELVARFVEILATPAGRRYLVLELLLLATAAGLWWTDGRPGLDALRGDRRSN